MIIEWIVRRKKNWKICRSMESIVAKIYLIKINRQNLHAGARKFCATCVCSISSRFSIHTRIQTRIFCEFSKINSPFGRIFAMPHTFRAQISFLLLLCYLSLVLWWNLNSISINKLNWIKHTHRTPRRKDFQCILNRGVPLHEQTTTHK